MVFWAVLALAGLAWNLVVLSCMAELKVPVSRKVVDGDAKAIWLAKARRA